MLLLLDVFLGNKPPENKWFPYEDWRGKGWADLNEYSIIDYDPKFQLIKVRRVV